MSNILYEAMELVLARINTVFADAGVALPARQYMSAGGQGETVHDSEQVTVSFDQMYTGSPGEQSQVPAHVDGQRTAAFVIEIVRAVPVARITRAAEIPPTPEEMNTNTQLRVTDAWLLMDAGLAAGQELNYTGSLVDITAGAPQGGMQATTMTLIVGIG